MTEYTFYMRSRMITNHVNLSTHDVMSSLLCFESIISIVGQSDARESFTVVMFLFFCLLQFMEVYKSLQVLVLPRSS